MLLAGRADTDLPPSVDQRVALEGLDTEGAGQLLQQRRPELHPDVVRPLVSRCGGNALALVESAADLDQEQVRGHSALDQDSRVPARVRAAYGARLAVLRARGLRLRALLAPRGDYDAGFDASVALDEAVGLRFHAARTLLRHGERLRRDRRRGGREGALGALPRCVSGAGGGPVGGSREAELVACGGSLRAATGAPVSAALTPQELQIAELVAGGPRNREIAGNLFLSLRTVEVHLSRVFRKLEISSRTQLVARMGD